MYNDEQTARVICLRKDKTAKRIYSKIIKKRGYQFQNMAHFFQAKNSPAKNPIFSKDFSKQLKVCRISGILLPIIIYY
ncbi:MAG: hypothetical protein DRR08_15525 [Candidatus Parabeggiatoa sp. nov. 2]|nr:MAG: hypothetical protein B6247_04135 [Beggiatoa sp. 4572_84]RKZ58795.1 MAG: hypothetical protein DRR08_15525 [Gammaproteobacteria bacterium]